MSKINSLIIFIAVFLAMTAGLLFWTIQKEKTTTSTRNQFLVYQNKIFGFSIEYPKGWYIWGNPIGVNPENLEFIYITPRQYDSHQPIPGVPDGINIAVSRNPLNSTSLDLAKKFSDNMLLGNAHIPNVDGTISEDSVGYNLFIESHHLEFIIGLKGLSTMIVKRDYLYIIRSFKFISI